MTNADKTLLDPCAGSGKLLIKYMKKHGFNPRNTYYNDNDIIKYENFIHANRRYGLGIPEKNITCSDFLEWGTDMDFDVTVSNPPFNSSGSDSGQGTSGNAVLYKTFYKKILDVTKQDGIIVMISPKGIISDLIKSNKEVIHLNLMTENDHWKYNTCYFIQKNNVSNSEFSPSDKIFNKIYSIRGNKNWHELNGVINQKRIDESGILCITKLAGANSPHELSKVIDGNKVLHGPKFVGTLLENAKSYEVTDLPIYANFYGAYSCSTIEEAEKVRLFVENNPLLKFSHKKLKTKGLLWTMKSLKEFDINQIVDGTEYPKEYNLTEEEIRYIESNI